MGAVYSGWLVSIGANFLHLSLTISSIVSVFHTELGYAIRHSSVAGSITVH